MAHAAALTYTPVGLIPLIYSVKQTQSTNCLLKYTRTNWSIGTDQTPRTVPHPWEEIFVYALIKVCWINDSTIFFFGLEIGKLVILLAGCEEPHHTDQQPWCTL